VPDLIWKKPETYKQESTEHFMDMEIFERAIKTMPLAKAFAMDRAEFTKTFPDLDIKAGRSFWRIREFMTKLDALSLELKKTELPKEKKLELQSEWLNIAGTMGHYVGDLAQPLHVTENYDGQLTDQKGIHAFFEDAVVDEFEPGEIENAAYKKARTLKLKVEGKSVAELLQQLATESNKSIGELLKIDKRIGRKDMNKAKAAYRNLIITRIAAGSVYLAELWSRSLGWKYDSEKFFNFTPAPAFIAPGADRAIQSN
jgi:hypothetical protein